MTGPILSDKLYRKSKIFQLTGIEVNHCHFEFGIPVKCPKSVMQTNFGSSYRFGISENPWWFFFHANVIEKEDKKGEDRSS